MSAGVFVCGSPYTEVSTVAWALTAHPSFWTAPESRFLYQLFGRGAALSRPFLYDTYLNCAVPGTWLEVNNVGYPEFVASIGRGIDELFSSRAGERRWIESSPENALIAEELLVMFPGSCIVGLLQPIESAAFVAFGGMLPAELGSKLKDIEAVSEHYRACLTRVGHQSPDRVYLLEEADLLAEPEQHLEGVLDFLGESPDPAVAQVLGRGLLKIGREPEAARRALASFARQLRGRGFTPSARESASATAGASART